MATLSPIGARFFSPRGLAVLMSEALWIWLPAVMIASAAIIFRERRVVQRR